MKIIELIEKRRPFLSLEFFPPKQRILWPDFFLVVEKLAKLHPLFVSVTYGAGGSTREFTLEIVSRLREEFGLEAMAHLTCVGSSRRAVRSFLERLRASGVDNVLALRGDLPEGVHEFRPDDASLVCAADLVAYIRNLFPDIGIGVAAYPEGHPEAAGRDEDLAYLKQKLDQGADFAITQLFFDNRLYGDFLRRASRIGVDKPIIPGILPVLSLRSLDRITGLCGASVPERLRRELREAGATGGRSAVRERGIRHAIEQARGLIECGAPGIHLYTMNRAETCLRIVRGLGGVGIGSDDSGGTAAR